MIGGEDTALVASLTFLDDPPHELVVSGLFGLVVELVPEVVGLVDDDEIVVPPIDVGEVYVPADAVLTGEVGVVENVVVEAITGEAVAPVVGRVDGPVVT